jgi:hypothetical protein
MQRALYLSECSYVREGRRESYIDTCKQVVSDSY